MQSESSKKLMILIQTAARKLYTDDEMSTHDYFILMDVVDRINRQGEGE
jgi:hypothetical protein